MSGKPFLRFGAILSAVYFIGLAYFLVLAIQDFPLSGVDRRYFAAWVAAESFIRWFDVLIILTITGGLITFSLGIPRRELPTEVGEVVKFMQKLVTLVLVLTVLAAVVQFAVYPQVTRARDSYLRDTERAQALIESVDAYIDDGDYASAVLALQEYVSIWEDDDDAQLRLLNLQRELVLRQDEEQPATAVPRRSDVQEQRAADLLERAQRLYRNEDFHTAVFYAQLAYRIDPSRADIAEFVQQIRQQIGPVPRVSNAGLSQQEQQDQQLFRAKQRGMEALLRNDPVSAYYIFHELQQSHPLDPDVRRYLPIAIHGDQELGIQGVRDMTYFIPEAQEVLTLPGYADLTFIHQWNPEMRELVSIERMVYGGGGVFFRDIEVLRISPEGEIAAHLTAPFGKLVSGESRPIAISLHGIHPEYPEIQQLPTYHQGRPADDSSLLLQLDIGVRELEAFDGKLDTASPLGLFRAMQVLPQYGFDILLPATAFLLLLTRPFSMFILLFAAIGLAIRMHSRYYGRPPLLGLLALPLLPLLSGYSVRLYEYMVRVATGAAVSTWGFAGGLTALLLLQVVLFAAVLFFTTRECMVRA
ncbi:tetratricopeptide repeat protein [Spirochaeta africana]|uniref:Uncharacterized protein n=1 Tax=Spirochaeta africana (strain ATCC 700263 / DSM 8902 / Z-7692) TaxID=889378 RepID=H9UMP8_SPIAZ|nr:hypothetical protein [Spirochaeta africana]AFG38791.1 hypothetical protein Spiaf_2767 [Spirochaeta africana DSM 8902]